ncbi:MAG: archaellin/type IV pilin N-terminal domain-containing protein [Halanaeroarchaeum sp.]
MDDRAERGQSEVLGVVLLVGLTVISVGALAAFGGTAVDSVDHQIDVRRAEQAVSQVDRAASLVALADAKRQVVDLGTTTEGSYTVAPEAGRVTITHVNYSDTNGTETIYDAPLGAVRYVTGDTVVAYQGGAVFRGQVGGGEVVVSPPEFHYRQQTLAFPVIRIEGGGSIAGGGSMVVREVGGPRPVFPNESATYSGSGLVYDNPVENGTIRVTVQSEFYRGWAAFFESRTAGRVTVDPGNETATVTLISTGTYGDFQMPMDGQPIELRGLAAGHPIDDFTITIAPDDADSAEFSNLQWSLWARQGDRKFEIAFRSSGKMDVGSSVPVAIYYADGDESQSWYAEDAFTVKEVDGAARIVANLTGNATLAYEDVGNAELTKFGGKETFTAPVTFDEHAADGNRSFQVGENATVGYLVNHYLQLMGPAVDLSIRDGENSGNDQSAAGAVSEDASYGHLTVEGDGKFVTYLYVTENDVEIVVRQ